MDYGRLPEIELTGGSALQHNIRELCRKVRLGKIVRVIDLRTGRYRAWMTRERPPGCEPREIPVFWLQRNISAVMDQVRDGEVFRVYDSQSGRVFGYLYWSAPEHLARFGVPFAYTYRSRTGRVIRRAIFPLSVESVNAETRVRAELASAV